MNDLFKKKANQKKQSSDTT